MGRGIPAVKTTFPLSLTIDGVASPPPPHPCFPPARAPCAAGHALARAPELTHRTVRRKTRFGSPRRSDLHPLRSAPTLKPADERRLYLALRTILAEAVERRGASIDDYTAPDGDGEMQERLQVYQRTGEPCPRCGRPIRRVVIGGRATHFCSWCQRLPGADRKSAASILRAMTGPRMRGRGGRWTELAAGDGAVGLTSDEQARLRTERTRRAAASRRAAARTAGAR